VKILGLLLRHFLLCLCFWWVEIQLRVISRFSVSIVRWQVRLIRFSGLFGLYLVTLFAIFCSGCAHKEIPTSYAPSSAPILRAVTSAKASAVALKGHVATPEGLRTLADLNASLDSSLTEVAAYSAKVDEVSVALTKAEEAANYWQAKQQKALRELWMWRAAAALLLGCVAGWFALRSGMKLAL
jgi:hypothetical protein